MTGVQMQEQVERKAKMLNVPSEKRTSEYIYTYLNDSQDLFIRKTFEEQFEKAQPELDDLRTLIVVDKELENRTPITVHGQHIIEADLPSDYRH